MPRTTRAYKDYYVSRSVLITIRFAQYKVDGKGENIQLCAAILFKK